MTTQHCFPIQTKNLCSAMNFIYLYIYLFVFLVGELLGHVRKRHPWADAKVVKVMMVNKLIIYIVCLFNLYLCICILIVLLNPPTPSPFFFRSQQLMDAKLYELLGERTAADDEKPSKKKKEKPAKVEVFSFVIFSPFSMYFYYDMGKKGFLLFCLYRKRQLLFLL